MKTTEKWVSIAESGISTPSTVQDETAKSTPSTSSRCVRLETPTTPAFPSAVAERTMTITPSSPHHWFASPAIAIGSFRPEHSDSDVGGLMARRRRSLGSWPGGGGVWGFCLRVRRVLVYLCFIHRCVASLSSAQNSKLKAVNLGNWLVVEGWMRPSLFDGIPNKDLLDGTKVQFKSIKLQRYLSAEKGGGSVVVVNRTSPSAWETFRLWRINENSYNFRVSNKQFVGLSRLGTNRIVAMRDAPGVTETFRIVRKDGEPNRVRIQASSNDLFLQAKSDTEVLTADYGGSGWDDDNPSVFMMIIINGSLQGEYQLTNGYGPDKAPQVLQDHRNAYITEEDFRFMSSNGLNAVRIPVGWWIAYDPTPPKPFVGGSLQALDNAFTWAQKYGMKVIIDLHAVQGSQNGLFHSATRDGYLEWGDSNIQDTLKVIDFLAARYAKNPALGAIELLNEPRAPLVTLDTLKKYYKAGYDAVRKYTSSAYVILSNRLGSADPKELLSFAQGLNRVVIEVHYYSLYSDMFNSFSVQQNIDFIYNQRGSDLAAVTTPNGPLSFVGEWVAEFKQPPTGPSSEDYYRRFAKAQIEVYGNATFGWAYWSYKCSQPHWSLKHMIDSGIINLRNYTGFDFEVYRSPYVNTWTCV